MLKYSLVDWTSELAPRGWRRPLAYITGWLLVLGWQADLASATYLGGVIIQGIAAINYPDYHVERWQVSIAPDTATTQEILTGFRALSCSSSDRLVSSKLILLTSPHNQPVGSRVVRLVLQHGSISATAFRRRNHLSHPRPRVARDPHLHHSHGLTPHQRRGMGTVAEHWRL